MAACSFRPAVPLAPPLPTYALQAQGLDALKPGLEGDLILGLLRNADGGPVGPVQVVHEKPFHVFVASTDLRHFDHLHPEVAATESQYDRLPLRFTPKQGGWHQAWVEFTPQGHAAEVVSTPFDVPGPLPPSPTPLLPDDLSQSKLVDGVHVTLAKDGPMLHFSLRQAGRIPVLTPYLGAEGHAIAIREGSLDLVHIHPQGAAQDGRLSFHANFPAAGNFKLWGEFQPEGRLIRADFVVRVSESDVASAASAHVHPSP